MWITNCVFFLSLSLPSNTYLDVSEPPVSFAALYASFALLLSMTLALIDPTFGFVQPWTCSTVSEQPMATAQKRTRTDHGEVVVVLGVERETERGPARHARGLEVLVAAREHELAEFAEATRGVPVAARVKVRAHEQHVELRLVLQRALDPARLALQVLGGLGDERFGDL